MKKVLAVVLCLLVLISSITTVLFSGVLANAEGNIFDNSDNWELYEYSSNYVNSSNGTAPTRGKITKNTNTAYTYGGDASSILVGAKIQLAVVEFGVKANTDYTLSYRFLAKGTKYTSNNIDTYLVRTGVVTSMGSVKWGQDGYILYMDTAKAYTAPNGVYADRTSIADRTAQWSDEGVWHQVTLNFNSGNNEKLKLLVQAGSDTCYFDDFNLTPKYDFESLSNWAIYCPDVNPQDANYVPTPTFDSSNTQKTMAWCNIKNDTVDADNTGKSIRINGNAFNVAAKLPVLKANTKYTLSFKYKPGSSTTVAPNSFYFTSRIIKEGTAFDSTKMFPAERIVELESGSATTDWKEISVDFTTDSTTNYMLEFRFAFGSGYVCYLDSFAIAEKTLTPTPPPATDTDPFEDINNWGIYHKDAIGDYAGYATVDGTAPAKCDWASITINSNAAFTSTGSGKSVKLRGNTFFNTVKLSDLKANTEYTLSFKYLIPKDYTWGGSSKAWFTPYIVKKGVAMNGATPAEYFVTGSKAVAPASPSDGSWKDMSLEFKTDATTDFFFALYSTFASGFEIYLDEMSLTEKVVIPEQTESVYDDASAWGFYHANGTATIDGTGPQSYSWARITNNTNKAYIYNNGEKSVKYYGNITFMATKLKDLVKDKTYTVSFKYFAPESSTKGPTSNAWCNQLGIYAGSTAMSSGLPSSAVVKGTNLVGDAGKWNDFTLDFTAASTDLYFGINPTFGAGFELYIDDFKVTEKAGTPAPEPPVNPDNPPVVPEKVPQEKVVIDFETEATGKNATLSPKDRMEIVEAEAYNGEKSTMLHFKKGQYSNATTLNYSSTFTNNTDKVFTVAVKPNTEYTFSVRAKANSQTLPDGAKAEWIGLYATYNKTNQVSFYQHSGKRDEWVYLEKTFTTAADQNVVSFYVNAGESTPDLWIDDITFTEKLVIPEPEPEPGPVPDDGNEYDDVTSWKLYHSDYNAPTINGNGLDSYSWIKNTQNTNKQYTHNGGAQSIKFYGNTQYTAIKLNDLEQGKAYKVRFMYFAPGSSVVGGSSKAWVNQVGVIQGGTSMNKNSPESYHKKGAVFAGEAGSWHEYSMLFRADTTDLYFGMCFTFASGFEIYIDDFSVTETDEDPDAIPVVPGKEPKDEIVIDFETEATGKNATLSPKDRIEIVEAEAYDGGKSNMLHFIKGQYDSPTTLNYSTTYTTDTDAVFTVGVKPNKVYKFSFRVKTNSQILPEGAKDEWIGIYATFGKEYIISSYQHKATRDEWLYYELTLGTLATQNLLSFYVNAGESTPDMWIDDIRITETDSTPFKGWGDEPREEYLINFDDFFVNFDNSAIKVEDGPERDGKISKAIHIEKGEYKTVLSSSKAINYKDPVFTVSVKENTLYEFSYYIYVTKNSGTLPYFGFYYDWSNTWLLRASGLQERNQWVKKTVRFVTLPGQTQLSMLFNAGEIIPDLYVDDICLKEIKPGTVAYSNSLSYCEECFNILAQKNLINQVTASKTSVIKIPVELQKSYTFGVTVNSAKKSNSRIYLSFDGVNPMNPSDPNAPSAIISADGTSGRYGIDFVSDTSGYIYLVIENNDGAITLEDPYLFLTNSMSTNLPMGRETLQEAKGLSVNANKGILKELIVFGSSAENEMLGSEIIEEGQNPETGSDTVLPVLTLCITLLIACAVLVKPKKGGEQA